MDTTSHKTVAVPDSGDATTVVHGVISDDPGTPCTPEYARSLTERALQLSDELDDTLTEIVRVRAWEPLGYRDPSEYVRKEFTQSSRSHRYRLARFAAFLHQLTERIGDEALELELTERALRAVPKERDGQVIEALGSRLGELEGAPADEVQDAVAETVRNHSRGAVDAEDEGWGEPAESPSSTRRSTGTPEDSDDPWDSERADQDDGTDGMSEAPAQPAAVPPSKADLAEAARFEEFLRALRVIAATGGELPGILDNADEAEEGELLELAENVAAVAAATSEALSG
ncbi:hypothetical protein [Streptomyces sp. NPDC101455]|uniref:hypothetical protein n=1 Tax=Streptomyces sp. NPDC101455 TaxID=3366142 RepID=UPI0038287BC4